MKFMTTRKRRRQEKTYSPKARSDPLPDPEETCSRRDTAVGVCVVVVVREELVKLSGRVG